MLEPLAGRLRWEQTNEGIRVAIPGTRGTLAMLYGPLIVIWLGLAAVHYWHLLGVAHTENSDYDLQMVAIALYFIGFCFFVCWLLFTFTSDTILLLDPATLKIQRRVLGIELASQSFPTDQVSQVLHIPAGRLLTSGSVIDPNTSKIQFRVNSRTHSFAKGITRREAGALIMLMLRVYEFPDSVAPTVIDA